MWSVSFWVQFQRDFPFLPDFTVSWFDFGRWHSRCRWDFFSAVGGNATERETESITRPKTAKVMGQRTE